MMGQGSIRNESTSQIAISQSRWRPWREITLVMLMVMEVTWVVPWFRSLTPATYAAGTIRSFMVFFLMIFAAHLLIRFLNYLRLKIFIRQTVMILFLIVSILIGFKYLLYSSTTDLSELINRPLRSFADWGTLIPDEFIVAIAVIIGWWRGISLAQAHVGPHLVMSNFNLGIVMFFMFGFVNTMVTGEAPGALLYVFIFTSLLAMSSSRMFVIHLLRGGGESIFDRRWFGGILLAALLVVLITVASTSFFGGGSGIVGYLLTGLFYILSVLIYLILSPILLLIIWIFNQISIDSEVFQSLSESLNNLRSMMQNALSNFGELFNQSGVARAISEWGPGIKTLLLWGIVILAVAGMAVWVSFQLWKNRSKSALDEEQQTILEVGDLWKLLRARIQDRLKDLWGSMTENNVFAKRRRLRAAERIRQIYIEMMDLCNTLNLPRPEAATPIEFMPDVKGLFPNFSQEIEAITLAYNRIRYGQLPEMESEVKTVESAWNKLEREGRILIDNKKRDKKNLPKFREV